MVTPLYVNFWTRQASLDGVTACCTITPDSGTPINVDEVVYLDMLPIGVVYVPPGDPRATGGAIPKQTFTAVNAKQTSTTTVTSNITGTTAGVSLSLPGVALTGSWSTSTQTQKTDLQQQGMSVMTQAEVAQGPGGYPGQNDIIEVYVNPTFDVQYLSAYSYSNQIPPIPVSPVILSISEHKPQPSDPGYPLSQWLNCSVEVQVLLTGGPSATCLSQILTAPPKGALPVNPVSGTVGPILQHLTLQERVLQLDPMVASPSILGPVSTAAPGLPGVTASPASAPPSVLNNPRFQLLAGPGGYAWTYCSDPGPRPFSAIDTTVTSGTYTTTKKTTSNVNFSLNPVQLVSAIVGAGSGSGDSGAGSESGSGNSNSSGGGGSAYSASVSFGESWELDTSVATTVQNTLTLSTTGNYGSGMTPPLIRSAAPGNPSNVWTPNTTYPNSNVANGNFVLPTLDNTYVYEVKTPGVSGGTEPTWCTTASCTVKDGTVVWVLFGNTCEALTQFTTGTYYDWVSNTLLFWTTPEPPGSALVEGNARLPQANQRVVFRPANGANPITVFTDSTGQFRVRLTPGSYTYQILDSAGHALTATPVPVTVPANQTVPIQLPPAVLSNVH